MWQKDYVILFAFKMYLFYEPLFWISEIISGVEGDGFGGWEVVFPLGFRGIPDT